ncbi:mitochondrial import inner membrane translocase subunit TIM44-2-like isoform X1 [Zingiber officinale]|uniref:mitochondrial import inner membrane translocase subunit TIM44-2-like isoform X1 n=2 Tax=Zingiber officinale TaxID=94328 RepID=UPI001C4CB411|nr:mitochondrial import inner membrane translocase subunit TIM44-2-like isoform X1 [Zingiber officinale]
MASAWLPRALRKRPILLASRQALNIHFQVIKPRHSNYRQFGVFNEFSKQLKGEAKGNTEFQQSMSELSEKIGVMKEDLKARTQKTTEKLYRKVDDIWEEAETVSKKVSENVKEQLSSAKEEVEETFGLNKEEPSKSSSSSTSTSRLNGENKTETEAENSEGKDKENKESMGQTESLFGKFKDRVSSASPKVSQAFQKIKETKISNLAMRGYNLVKDELTANPNSRKRMQYASASVSSEPRSMRTDITVVPSKKSILGEKWEAFKKKMHSHPIFKRLSGYSQPVVTKGQELAEDMRERWETSDNPVVHKIQDLNETVFGETATALSFKEIRRRDPSFSLPDFVAEVQEMVRPVLTAYFKADLETLKKYCTPEVIERCKGERNAYESQGMFFDNKILHISEVDVRETKMMGSSPLIIVAFQTQQIYCVRDREGSITAGGKDSIQTVLYAWAMQLIDIEELGEGAYFPQWKLREMQQLGFQALI